MNSFPFSAEALIEQATFSLTVMEAKAALSDAWLAHKQTTEEKMQKASPALWSIPQWRKQQIASLKAAFMKVSLYPQPT